MFDSVLVANRGEIAVRVMTACQEVGIRTVAVYSDIDRHALHVRRADEAYAIGPAPAAESYLNISAIIAAARAAGAQAIHPGYGFLSENAEFAQACAAAQLVFIGPPPAAMRLMGSKIAAKRAVELAGVPTVPGYAGPARDTRGLLKEAQRIGFPVLIKAAAGGGGKGMREVNNPRDFAEALEAARREALAAFGDDTIFLEKLLVAPRHVEFQILADAQGNTIHLGERECSIQRRHQKILEESPCVALTPALRAAMGAAAVAAARAAGYVNAGTCEFLLDDSGQYYFLEMNTRLQVEHPVTELVTGMNLVQWQLKIAAGEPLDLQQDQIAARGHAIEVRLYAEDPAREYLPSTGTVLEFAPPWAPGVRVDSGVEAGDQATMYYDPMLAKLIVHAENRAAAVARLRWSLDHWAVLGVTTNLPLLRAVVADREFVAGHTDTRFLQRRNLASVSPPASVPALVLVAAAVFESHSSGKDASSRSARSPWSPDAQAGLGGEQRIHYQVADQDYHVTMLREPGLPDAVRVRIGDALYPAADSPPFIGVVGQRKVTLYLGTRVETMHIARLERDLAVMWCGDTYRLRKPQPPDVDQAARGADAVAGQLRLVTPMAGTVIKVNVAEGAAVAQHETVAVLGAMKMEHAIAAPYAGRVRRVFHTAGDVVPGGEPLVEIEATGADGPKLD